MPYEPSEMQDRLSAIVTRWTLLQQAHRNGTDEARQAHEALLKRYGGAIRRYLLACVRQPDIADELYQEFAIKLIQGGLKGADPDKGRFRHYLKGVLFHLLADQHQKNKRHPVGWISQLAEPSASDPSVLQEDAAFLEHWRADILANAWDALKSEEAVHGQPWHTVLGHRRDHPDQRSEDMATALSSQLGKSLSASGVRQTLHRARERFAEIVLDQVMHSLKHATVDELHAELVDLRLIQYCEPAFMRLQQEQA